MRRTHSSRSSGIGRRDRSTGSHGPGPHDATGSAPLRRIDLLGYRLALVVPTAPPQHDAEADEPDADDCKSAQRDARERQPAGRLCRRAVCAGAVAEVPFAVVESDFTTTTAFGLYWSPAAVAGVVPAA